MQKAPSPTLLYFFPYFAHVSVSVCEGRDRRSKTPQRTQLTTTDILKWLHRKTSLKLLIICRPGNPGKACSVEPGATKYRRLALYWSQRGEILCVFCSGLQYVCVCVLMTPVTSSSSDRWRVLCQYLWQHAERQSGTLQPEERAEWLWCHVILLLEASCCLLNSSEHKMHFLHFNSKHFQSQRVKILAIKNN